MSYPDKTITQIHRTMAAYIEAVHPVKDGFQCQCPCGCGIWTNVAFDTQCPSCDAGLHLGYMVTDEGMLCLTGKLLPRPAADSPDDSLASPGDASPSAEDSPSASTAASKRKRTGTKSPKRSS